MISKRARQTMLSVVSAFIVGYFLYHTVEGDRGWFSMLKLENEVQQAHVTLSKLHQEHDILNHRDHLLKANGTDPDLLDEEARRTLNYSKPNEVIILNPSLPPSPPSSKN